MRDGLREFIPKRAFQSAGSYDLPSSLLDGCVHWLNISEGVLEIRQASNPWVTRFSDWKVDIRTRRATRRKSSLVNPHGSLAAKIGRIFQGISISCSVNNNKLLESKKLGLEIDQDQDIQTLRKSNLHSKTLPIWTIAPVELLYFCPLRLLTSFHLDGFMSMIVLREVYNHQQRSIITANGLLEWHLRGIHSEVTAKANNDYYRFSVDRILGRLTCAPEPGQLLFKGLLHAFTSFVLPDVLTGRTGTEEAFAILASGQCQPWQPLDPKSTSIIKSLAALGPQREYYPSDKRHLQKVIWDKRLSPTAQSDFFYTAVHRIASKSNHLCGFSLKGSNSKFVVEDCHSHLRRRGKVQSSRYQRTNDITKLFTKGKVCVYEPRDRKVSPRAENTYHISSICWDLHLKINTSRELKSIMRSWSLIGGFKDTSSDSSTTLGSLIEDHMSHSWGAHLQFCKRTYLSGRFKLIFHLSLLAFSGKPDMDMIKALAAFGRVKELIDLPTPSGSSFSIAEEEIQPNEDKLATLLAPFSPGYVEDPKLRREEQERKRRSHQDSQTQKCHKMARHLVKQWPVESPTFERFNSSTMDLEAALEAVKPKWLRAYQNFQLLEYIEKA
ncbi:hypothetical protein PG997_012474 [Apiospora hydei]|uniref:Uncharacterized protein n=1 Tax=Apiospora hydei TaxID=1337664 RepID=A0ABR1V3J1_9PEZI